MSSESFPSGSDVLEGLLKASCVGLAIDPFLLARHTRPPWLDSSNLPVIHLYNKVKERAKMNKVTIVRASEVGACETDGGKFCAFCDEHNYFVQGTRKSLEGRFTFEICPKCEWPSE